jgi:hypothetical protein
MHRLAVRFVDTVAKEPLNFAKHPIFVNTAVGSRLARVNYMDVALADGIS